jgi:hypothetical protein
MSDIEVTTALISPPVVVVEMLTGQPGAPGEDGTDANWTQMTQAQYDALVVKDPTTLYVIVG